MLKCSTEHESYSEFLCISIDYRHSYNKFLSSFEMHSCLSAHVPLRQEKEYILFQVASRTLQQS